MDLGKRRVGVDGFRDAGQLDAGPHGKNDLMQQLTSMRAEYGGAQDALAADHQDQPPIRFPCGMGAINGCEGVLHDLRIRVGLARLGGCHTHARHLGIGVDNTRHDAVVSATRPPEHGIANDDPGLVFRGVREGVGPTDITAGEDVTL